MDTTPLQPADMPPSSSRKRWMSALFFIIGIALLAGAVWAVLRQQEALHQAWTAARGASPLVVILCLLLPISNWLSASATIWVLTGRFGKVRFGEMIALIAAAWLLNLLPMRPGMVGRVAYHRRYNGISVRNSLRALVAALLCTGCAMALLLMMVVLAARASALWVWVFLALPLAAMGAAAVASRKRGHVWRWPAAIGLRYIDMATWAVRYWLVFQLIGKPVGILGAGALTGVAQMAMLTPVQFGLREWAIGVASTSVPGGPDAVGSLMEAAAPGLLADGVMRAAEMLIVLPVGLAGSLWVWRRMRRPESTTPPKAEAAAAEQL